MQKEEGKMQNTVKNTDLATSNVWIIIQARTGSTRLPEKVLMDFGGVPLIKFIYDTCKLTYNKTVVAIPTGDKKLIQCCVKHDIRYLEGPEDNVLERYRGVMETLDCTHAVRITSDCPLINQNTLLRVIGFAMQGIDFVTNLPCVDGYDIEAISMKAILRTIEDIVEEDFDTRDYEKHDINTSYFEEHVTMYIRDNIKNFKDLTGARIVEPYLIEWFPKLSIDTQEDLDSVRAIYAKIKARV